MTKRMKKKRTKRKKSGNGSEWEFAEGKTGHWRTPWMQMQVE